MPLPQVAARVEEHTDSPGDAAANRATSFARTRAAVAWLSARGVSEGRWRLSASDRIVL
jgi:outer membrane protein OmpA-like peptidoglycan-associated protein